MAADDAVRFLADQLGYGKYLDKNGMDRTKLAVLEMLGRTGADAAAPAAAAGKAAQHHTKP